jgi:hypothetical protein
MTKRRDTTVRQPTRGILPAWGTIGKAIWNVEPFGGEVTQSHAAVNLRCSFRSRLPLLRDRPALMDALSEIERE